MKKGEGHSSLASVLKDEEYLRELAYRARKDNKLTKKRKEEKKTFKHSFLGQEFVAWVEKERDKDKDKDAPSSSHEPSHNPAARREALAIAEKLFKLGYIEGLSNERTFKDGAFVYQFIKDPVPTSGTGALPPLVADCLEWLYQNNAASTEGLFRISGENSLMTAIKARYDKGKKVDLDKEAQHKVHVVAGILKRYLRDLPIPLLTFEFYDCFIAIMSVRLEESRLLPIKTVLALLPQANLNLLRELLKFLKEVTSHSDTNQMTANNLAIVFAPALLRPDTQNVLMQMAETGESLNIVRLIICNYDYLFGEADGEGDEMAGQEYEEFFNTLQRGTVKLQQNAMYFPGGAPAQPPARGPKSSVTSQAFFAPPSPKQPARSPRTLTSPNSAPPQSPLHRTNPPASGAQAPRSYQQQLQQNAQPQLAPSQTPAQIPLKPSPRQLDLLPPPQNPRTQPVVTKTNKKDKKDKKEKDKGVPTASGGKSKSGIFGMAKRKERSASDAPPAQKDVAISGPQGASHKGIGQILNETPSSRTRSPTNPVPPINTSGGQPSAGQRSPRGQMTPSPKPSSSPAPSPKPPQPASKPVGARPGTTPLPGEGKDVSAALGRSGGGGAPTSSPALNSSGSLALNPSVNRLNNSNSNNNKSASNIVGRAYLRPQGSPGSTPTPTPNPVRPARQGMTFN